MWSDIIPRRAGSDGRKEKRQTGPLIPRGGVGRRKIVG